MRKQHSTYKCAFLSATKSRCLFAWLRVGFPSRVFAMLHVNHGEDIMRYYICTLSSFPRQLGLLGETRGRRECWTTYVIKARVVFTYFDNSTSRMHSRGIGRYFLYVRKCLRTHKQFARKLWFRLQLKAQLSAR